MGGSKWSSSSRVPLIFVVLLIGAIAGANCSLTVENFSEFFVAVFDVTTPAQSSALPPGGFFVKFPVNPTGASPSPETLTFFKFTTAPNTTASAPDGVKESFPFLTAFVWDNATISISQTNITGGKMGFTIDYPAQ